MGRKLRHFTTNFTGGELAPQLDSRGDLTAYQNGAARLRNVAQLVQGGVRRRPGTVYIDELDAGPVQMEEFLFNDEQGYLFLFRNGVLDLYDQNATASGQVTGCPWTAEMVGELNVAQQGDVMLVVSSRGDLPTRIIRRTGAFAFQVEPFVFETHSSGAPMYQPYHRFAAAGNTLTPSATTGAGITLTLSSDYWTTSHVNTIIRHKKKEILVTAVTSATVATGTVRETLTDTNADGDWDEQVFSVAHGWPRTVRFFGGRLFFGGSRDLPSHVFGSNVGAYFKFDVGTGQDNEAIQHLIAENQIGEIRGLTSLRHLQIFTNEMELYLPVDEDKPLTPANIVFKKQTRYGSSRLPAAEFDGAVLFATKSRNALREFLFDDIQQGYTSPALTYLAPHMIFEPVQIKVHLETPQAEQYCYLVNGDGTLATFLSIRSEKIAGWVLWETDGLFKSISVVNGRAFVVVEREIMGHARLYLEHLDWGENVDAAMYLKHAQPLRFWQGLNHLAGRLVAVNSFSVVDCEECWVHLGIYEVSQNGELDLGAGNETDNISVGLNFEPELTTLPPEFQVAEGTVFGELKRIVRVVVSLAQTFAVEIRGTELILRNVTDDFSQSPKPVNGRFETYLLGWDRYGQLTIRQSVPLPMTINGLMVELEV